jgi:hypothetical protein
MSPNLIVIRSVSLQDTAQVRFAEHDEVVERFATDRSDDPLNVAVLPRLAWCGRVISDSHCTNAADVRRTECPVAVANQVTRRFVPGKRVRHLTRDPLAGRIVRHADAHQSPAGVTKNDQAVEQLEGGSTNREQIDGRDPSAMVAQECLPTLGRVAAASWSCTSLWLIRRPRSRASAVRRVSAALPHSGFSLCIRRMRSRIVAGISSANRPESRTDATGSRSRA